jgi:hypothetical protein
MTTKAVIGALYGDEGKGLMTDYMVTVPWCVRTVAHKPLIQSRPPMAFVTSSTTLGRVASQARQRISRVT